jgi:crotonobetainyl-CoA:carnitine CoA-transferase CaiB-like acyl-CoA transferase
MARALEGIRVLDVTSYIAGPFATMLLGDLGAEIIKIETPGEGDPFRTWDKEPKLYSPIFCSFNRNKKSLTLNLRSEEGKEIFLGLVRDADVVVENFRPGVVERLGIGYDAVRGINPRIVYCSISAFGQSGPYRERPGYDTIGQALSGLLSILTDLESPRGPGAPFSDHLGGVYGCYGILGALLARERTGEGQKVETSLLEGTMSFIGYSITQSLFTGEVPRMGTRLKQAQVYAFVAADDLPFVIHLSHPPKFWQGLTEVAARADLREDPRFKDRHARIRNYDELAEILKEIFRTKPRDHWLGGLLEHDVPCAPIRRLDEVFEDPQVRHLDRLVTIRDPELGAFQLVKNGANLLGTPIDVALSPPKLGEHTEEILTGAGHSAQEIRDLRERRVI